MKRTSNRFSKRIIATLMSLAMMLCMCAVSASAEGGVDNSGGISTTSYLDPDSFTFSNYNIGNTRTFDGNKIAFEINATSSTATTIKVEVHIDGSTVYSYDVPTNSGTLKYDHIPMGYTGDHSVYFVYRCSGTATVDMKMYSWTD